MWIISVNNSLASGLEKVFAVLACHTLRLNGAFEQCCLNLFFCGFFSKKFLLF